VSTAAPLPASVHDRRWLALVVVCIAQFMVVLDGTVVNVALPSIQEDLDFSAGSLQWVVNAYTLAFGGFLLLGGRAADFLGRRRLFVAGVVVFTGASLLNGLATSSEWLIVARALQGLGGAMVSPAALSIVTTTFREGAERAKALAVWAAIAVGGAAVGLLAGGILTEYLSWEWIFFINIPIGIAAVLLAFRYVPESKAPGTHGVDIAGAVSVTAGLTLLVYTIVKTADYGWLSPETIGMGLGAVALLAAFVVIEMRSKAPLVRLGIFRIRSLTGANLAMLAVTGGMFAVFYFASIYLQQTLGFTPVQTGLAFLPLTAGIIAFSGVAQQIVGKVGVREVAMVGMGTAAIGLLLLSRAPVDGTYVADVLPGLLVMSAGLGLTFVRGRRAGVGDLQLLAADRRCARPRDPLDRRGHPDVERAGERRPPARRGTAGVRPGRRIPVGVRDRRRADAAGRRDRRDAHPAARRGHRRRGPERGARRVGGADRCPRTSAPTRAATGRRSWRPRRSCSRATAPASAWTISRVARGSVRRPCSAASRARRTCSSRCSRTGSPTWPHRWSRRRAPTTPGRASWLP